MTEASDVTPPARPVVAVVDDHELNRRVIRHILDRFLEPVDIVEGKSGFDAIELRFADPSPAMMIINGEMPGMWGQDAMREIRRREADEGLPRMPIVFESADPYAAEKVLLHDADLWLDRPFSQPQVAAVVRFITKVPCRTGGTRGG